MIDMMAVGVTAQHFKQVVDFDTTKVICLAAAPAGMSLANVNLVVQIAAGILAVLYTGIKIYRAIKSKS